MLFSKKAKLCATQISSDAGHSDNEGANLKRRNGVRARSVPVRKEQRPGPRPSSSDNSDSESRPVVRVSRALSRNRSNSCTALDQWFAGDMDWRAVVHGGAVECTESNLGAVAPILDIRHSCVKSESPTVVHQERPHSLTPQSAELVLPDDVVIPSEVASYHMSSADVAPLDRTAVPQLLSHPPSADNFQNRGPILSVDIPNGDLFASASKF
ncbi:hypothetical protein PsYK624_029580 [Phanerochaete sordida]|uniref:Uncharacterized protein n=1 Tax=Phanerochaete sordida TaxID=48140 RepID=A0A9P3L984_9APHY|nr:hypothetical protein PsYK624_029580 [Phanerochaete sordida]